MRKIIILLLFAGFMISIKAQTTFVFNGNGNWSDSANWVNRQVPPAVLPVGDTILINPVGTGVCLLDKHQLIKSGAFFSVAQTKKLNIPGDLVFSEAIALDSLSGADADILMSIQDTLIRLQDLLLEDGQPVLEFLQTYDPGFLTAYPSLNRPFQTLLLTPPGQKKLFISKMLCMANYLVTPSNHTYPDDNPPQTGLAYSYGSKEYNIKQYPPAGECRDRKIYGLDCSGMLYQMTMKAGLPEVVPRYLFSVEAINDVSKWNNALLNSEDFKNLRMEDKGMLNLDGLKAGDIIIWPRAPHVGVVGKGRYIFNSRGYSSLPKCINNTAIGFGPRTIPVTSGWVNGFGQGIYKIFRLEPVDISTNALTSIKITSLFASGNINYAGNDIVTDKGICWAKHANPTIDVDTSESSGTGNIALTISNLDINTTYYIRSYVTITNPVTNEGATYYGNEIVHETLRNDTDTFTDPRDNQRYPFKKIGTYTWMTKNMNYDLPLVSWAYDDNLSNSSVYGRLYTWASAPGAAPPGWHIASVADWADLFDYLYGPQVAGGYMKDLTRWNPPNVGATNLSGFSALPGGFKYDAGSGGGYADMGNVCFWWTPGETVGNGITMAVTTNGAHVSQSYAQKERGMYVRCVKD